MTTEVPAPEFAHTHRLANSCMPLAVYREVAAHLQQVPGVKTQLHCQPPAQFNYQRSQVSSIEICSPAGLSLDQQQRLQEILDYYSQRFGAWEPIS